MFRLMFKISHREMFRIIFLPTIFALVTNYTTIMDIIHKHMSFIYNDNSIHLKFLKCKRNKKSERKCNPRIFPHSNIPTLEYSNTRIFPHSNIPTLEYSHTWIFPHSNIPTLEYSHTRIFPHSNIPTIEYSNTRIFPHSNIPKLEYSHTRIFPHSNIPIQARVLEYHHSNIPYMRMKHYACNANTSDKLSLPEREYVNYWKSTYRVGIWPFRICSLVALFI